MPRTALPVVIGRAGPSGARRVVLSGHLDVVPAGDPGTWTVDPWAAEGYHGASGTGQGGCRVTSPGGGRGGGGAPGAPAIFPDRSAGRFPDGRDTDSNCNDFYAQAATTTAVESAIGATSVKVASVNDFSVGQTIVVDAGAASETGSIASIGTPGGSTMGTPSAAGATAISVTSLAGFSNGQTITIDSGGNIETAVIASTAGGGRGGGGGAAPATITVTAPLKLAHGIGAQVSGSGITLTTPLAKQHAAGVRVASAIPTPGAPNQYTKRQ